MAGNSIVVNILGNVQGLSRALSKAQSDLGGLDRISDSIGKAGFLAAASIGGIGAAAVGAGAVGAAALLAIPAALGGLGVYFAAQATEVRAAFSGLGAHVKATLTEAAAPLIPVLVQGATQVRAAFDTIAPSLQRIFAASAPLVTEVFGVLVPLAEQLGPMFETAFGAAVPVFSAMVQGLIPLTAGIRGFFDAISVGSPAFAGFITGLFTGIGALLPAVGQLLSALAPIGTQVLGILLPAVTNLVNFITARVVPVIQQIVNFIQNNQKLVLGIAIALGVLYIAIQLITVVMGIVTAVTTAFGVAVAVATSPITLIVLAIIALIAIGVLLYKNWDTISAYAKKAWGAVKDFIINVATSVKDWVVNKFNEVKDRVTSAVQGVLAFIRGNWPMLLSILTGPIGAAVIAIVRNWDQIKATATAAFTALKTIIASKLVEVVATVAQLPGRIKAGLGNLGSLLLSAGGDLIRGFVNGIGNAAGAAVTAAKNVASRVVGGVRSALGIASPSKVFRKIGQFTVAGLTEGLGKTRALASAARNLSTVITRGYEVPSLALSGVGGGTRGGNTYNLHFEGVVAGDPMEYARYTKDQLEKFEKVNGR